MGYMTSATTGVILSSGNTVFNEASADKDFRIESDGNTHQLFVDAGNNRLGIGTSTPLTTVDIEDGLTTVGAVLTLSTKEPTVVDGDVIGRVNFRAPLETGADALLLLASIHAEADATFDATTNSTELVFSTAAGDAAAERVRITSAGNVGIGTSTPGQILQITDLTENDGPMIRLSGSGQNGANNLLGGVEFHNSDTSGDGPNVVSNVKSFSLHSGGHGGYMTFGTHDGTESGEGSEPVERMRITGTGDVQVAGLTASEIVITDGTKGLTSAAVGTYPSLAELAHVKGVTSAVQTQLGTKEQVGKKTMWVPAAAMYPSTTNPCSDLTQVETTALRPDLKVLDFDDGADEFAQFTVSFPKSWNEGTVTFQPFWTVSATGTNTVAWELAGISVANDASINTAFGTQVGPAALAHSGTSNDQMVSVESGAVTITGAAVDTITYFQINRNTAADNHASDARLIGIKIFYTTNAVNDA